MYTERKLGGKFADRCPWRRPVIHEKETETMEVAGTTKGMTNPNKALWEKGDFTKIAALMRRSGEAVVHSIGITPPLRALDLGCGDGTTAVPLALLGAEVTGIDIARNLV